MNLEYRHTRLVRFFHWWNGISMILLALSGFYIHFPDSFLFSVNGCCRNTLYLHYAVGAGVIGRLYYAFVSVT